MPRPGRKKGEEREITDWTLTLPDGRTVPRVRDRYTYLGVGGGDVGGGAAEGEAGGRETLCPVSS